MTASTASTARAAALVVEHAENIGLPAPTGVTYYRDDKGLLAGGVWLTFACNADVDDWAEWMEAETTTDLNGTRHVAGTALDLYVHAHAELMSTEVSA